VSGFELVLDVQARLGESPVWSAEEGALYFADIKGRAIHRFEAEGRTHRSWAVEEDVGCIGLAKGGGFVAGLRSGVWRLDEAGRKVERLAANPEDPAASRFNDGRCDPAGRFLAGTIDEPKAGGRAHLYRYDRRGLAVLVGGLLTSNGLAFSPDGRVLYHADTPRFVVHRYDYDLEEGTLANRRVFVQLKPREGDRGRPDGAAVDAEGCYWTALYEGGRVHRYSAEGRLMSVHPVPAKRPTMVAFGGADLRTLYVTTARDGAGEDELARFPLSGGVFAMQADTPGLPGALFDPER